ncbi:excinuclease ABC subunit UvrC [bacterium]|nr:excinuclease ABC subunit UvrC [bacterium]
MKPLHDIARAAPRAPGVYLFKDAAGKVLYVGKASSLRDRLAYYFSGRIPDKTRLFLKKAADLEILLCRSEYEAFMLEYTLIKEHQPAFNVVFRDDKRYPYLKITSEDFPRLIVTRRVEEDGGRYFGPFVSGSNVRRILDMTHRFFKIRTCKRRILEGKKNPPLCLEYHLKRCDGPCEALVSKAVYAEQIARAERFLRGDYGALLAELGAKMREASGARSFELAALYRDQIAAVRELSEKQRAASARATDIDAISFASDPNRGRICFYVFRVRKGHIIGSAGFVFPLAAADEAEALGQFLPEYYKLRTDIPTAVALRTEPAAPASLRRWLARLAGRAVKLWAPQRGYARDLVGMAEKNARAKLFEKSDPDAEELLDRVREKLQLDRRPECIHGYDVANLGPSIVTGARVVFLHGKPARTHYRSYGLQELEAKDDYAAMEELVRRSVRRAVEQEPEAAPDLLLIDGGLGHVRAARKALRPFSSEVDLKSAIRNPKSEIHHRPGIEIAGLAKEEERLVLEDGRMLRLAGTDPVLNLLRRIRDEAHRFSRRLMTLRAKKKMLARKA